jgi:hypothetical protein
MARIARVSRTHGPGVRLNVARMSGHRVMLWAGVAIVGLTCSRLALTGAQTPRPPQPVTLDTDPALVAWWRFDETSGKTAADASGHKHHGTLDGGLSFDAHSAPGRLGRAICLDGANHIITVPGFKGVTGTQPRTVAAWIKTSKRAGEIVSWGANEHGQMFIVGHIRGRVGLTPKGGYLYMKTPTDDDAWHHVAVVVHEGSPPNLHDHVKLFKDGELAEIDDIGLLDLWPIETGSDQDVSIGRRFNGCLDELRIYQRALSEEEIKALFNLQTDRPLTNLSSKGPQP